MTAFGGVWVVFVRRYVCSMVVAGFWVYWMTKVGRISWTESESSERLVSTGDCGVVIKVCLKFSSEPRAREVLFFEINELCCLPP